MSLFEKNVLFLKKTENYSSKGFLDFVQKVSEGL